MPLCDLQRMDIAVEVTPDNTWNVGAIRLRQLNWGRFCRFCGTRLLTGERQGFCCGANGKFLHQVPRLPPQSEELRWLSSQPGISGLSRRLNLLFSFAAMETTGSMNRLRGPDGFVAIEGKVYHRLRPEVQGTGLRWVLYDGYDRDATPRGGRNVPTEWIEILKQALTRDNPFARQFLTLRTDVLPDNTPNHVIHLKGTNSVGEIAAITRYDSTAIDSVDPRNLVVCVGHDAKVQIPTISRLWEPLAYPLFFDRGTLGWGIIGSSDTLSMTEATEDSDVQSTQMWYYRIRLLTEERFHIFGRLTNEYIVDMWTREIETRLHYYKMNAERRMQQDAELMGQDLDDTEIFDRENVYLPKNFIGSTLWASDNVRINAAAHSMLLAMFADYFRT